MGRKAPAPARNAAVTTSTDAGTALANTHEGGFVDELTDATFDYSGRIGVS